MGHGPWLMDVISIFTPGSTSSEPPLQKDVVLNPPFLTPWPLYLDEDYKPTSVFLGRMVIHQIETMRLLLTGYTA